jgi:hypothetical protein
MVHSALALETDFPKLQGAYQQQGKFFIFHGYDVDLVHVRLSLIDAEENVPDWNDAWGIANLQKYICDFKNFPLDRLELARDFADAKVSINLIVGIYYKERVAPVEYKDMTSDERNNFYARRRLQDFQDEVDRRKKGTITSE